MSALAAAGAQIQGARMRQEDAWHVDRFAAGELLAIVADGLGGHPAGDVASAECVAAMARMFAERRGAADESPREWLKHAVLGADRLLHEMQRRSSELLGMASTVVVLYVRGNEFWAASVGDSYLLLRRQGKLLVLNELHAEGGGVTSCVGFNLSRVDLADRLLVEPGDRFLLATDGIAALDGEEINALVGGAADADGAVRDVLAAIEQAGLPHQDNATAVAVFT